MALRKFCRCHSRLHFRKSPVVFGAHAFSVLLISRLDDLDARDMSASLALYTCSAERTSSGEMAVGGRRVERAIFDAAASCAPFVELCVGAAPALTPAQALEVLRGHRKLQLTLHPKPFKKLDYLVWEGTEEQVGLIQDWLGRPDFCPEPGQRFDLDFYDNFHGLETMY